MSLVDPLSLRGEVDAYVFKDDVAESEIGAMLNDKTHPEWQKLVSKFHTANVVTNIGRAQMTKIIVGETTALALFMGLSTTAPVLALTDTALPNEIFRVPLAIHQSFSSYYQRYVAYFSTISFTSTGVAADGLFDVASTGGNMWAEGAITVSKSLTQALIVDHRILASS